MALEQSQVLARFSVMSAEEIATLQLAKLRRQLTRLEATNGFFRERFAAARLDIGAIRSIADFRARVPAMGKQDCLEDQAALPPFGRRVGIARDEVVLVNLTGGTSGQGQEVYGRSNHDVAIQGHLHYLPWYLAGLRLGDIALNCVPAGGLTTGGWGPAEGFRVGGATAFAVGGTLGTDAKIDLMCRFGEVHFIYASTSYLHTLTEGLRRRGIDPKERFPMLKTLFVAAEGYPVEWAERVESFWGARLHEGYGSTQAAGFAAGTTEGGAVHDGQRGPLHVFEWHNVVEVLDPQTGEPVREGEEGEIVLTNLDIVGSPVIRFRTRDRARLLGRHQGPARRAWLALEAGTIGRLDDMMKIRGNNVWPSAVDAVMFAHPEVWDYAGRVFLSGDGRTQVELRVATKPDAIAGDDGIAALFGRLRAELKAATNVSMDLRAVERAELPNYDYKSRRWSDERGAGFKAGAADR